MNHVLEAKKVVNPLSQTERGAGERHSPAGSSVTAHDQLRGSHSRGLFIHLFIDLTLNWEFIYLLMCSFTENQPNPASLPVNISLASPMCLALCPALGPRGKTWGCVAEGLDCAQAGMASAGPHMLLD